MTIDIITFTDEQYATLTEEQIREVEEAQTKKDKLTLTCAQKKEKEKYRLVKNGIFVSSIWSLYCADLDEQLAKEVENIRQSLLFYLRFTMQTEQDAPYEVNYALSETERVQIVKGYYDTKYTDAAERFNAFKADKVAKQYLGEMYAAVWDYYYLQTQ